MVMIWPRAFMMVAITLTCRLSVLLYVRLSVPKFNILYFILFTRFPLLWHEVISTVTFIKVKKSMFKVRYRPGPRSNFVSFAPPYCIIPSMSRCLTALGNDWLDRQMDGGKYLNCYNISPIFGQKSSLCIFQLDLPCCCWLMEAA